MNNLIDVLAYIIIPIIGSIFLLYILIDSIYKIGFNIHINKILKYIIFTIYIIVVIALSLLNNGFINLFMCVLILPIIAHFVCNKSRTYFVYYIGICLLTFLLDLLLTTLYQTAIVQGLIYFNNLGYYIIFYVVASKLITYIFLKLYVRVIKKREHSEIGKIQYFSSFILPLFSIIFVYTLLYFMQIYYDEYYIILFLVNIAFILIINIYFSKILEIMEKNFKLKKELELYNQQEKLQYQYYEDIEKKYQQSVSIIHDIRNHIQVMEGLYQSSNNTKALDYAEDVHQMLNKLAHKYYTNHKLLNIIINDKVKMMDSLNIKYNIKIGDIDWSVIEDIDITIIFGNILDNAIEAAKGLDNSQIELMADMIQNFICIRLINTIHKDLANTTIKQGTGLKNVERVIKKYSGDIQYLYHDNEFTVSIMLL